MNVIGFVINNWGLVALVVAVMGGIGELLLKSLGKNPNDRYDPNRW